MKVNKCWIFFNTLLCFLQASAWHVELQGFNPWQFLNPKRSLSQNEHVRINAEFFQHTFMFTSSFCSTCWVTRFQFAPGTWNGVSENVVLKMRSAWCLPRAVLHDSDLPFMRDFTDLKAVAHQPWTFQRRWLNEGTICKAPYPAAQSTEQI